MNKNTICIILYIFTASLLRADNIIIYNEVPNKDISLGTYYINKKAERQGPIYTIKSGENKNISRPDRKLGFDRKIYLSESPDDLKSVLSTNDISKLGNVAIGNTRGNKFFIGRKDTKIDGYNEMQWKIIFPFVDKITQIHNTNVTAIQSIADLPKNAVNAAIKTVDQTIEGVKAAYTTIYNDKYKKKIATVQPVTTVQQEEKRFLEQRGQITAPAIDKLIKTQSTRKPTIAVSFSGGGYRAMFATFGWSLAAKEIGLLDCITYQSALSGSTWALSSWLSQNESLDKTYDKIISYTETHLLKDNIALSNIIKSLELRDLSKQEISIVDFFGALLANTLLKKIAPNNFDTNLNSLQKGIENGKNPLPILTAVIAPYPYEWIYMTPYQVSSKYLNMSIPWWSLGRNFENNKTTNESVPLLLSYIMGICGSAFSASIGDALREKLIYDLNPDQLEKILKILPEQPLNIKEAFKLLLKILKTPQISPNILKDRPEGIAAHISNPTYKGSGPMKNNPTLELIDGGYGGGDPMQPFFEVYKADVILVMAASEGIAIAVNKFMEWAKRHNVPTPNINADEVSKKDFVIYKGDLTKKTPTIIFFILHVNPFPSAFKLQYTQSEALKVVNTMRENVLKHSDAVKNIIKEVTESLQTPESNILPKKANLNVFLQNSHLQ